MRTDLVAAIEGGTVTLDDVVIKAMQRLAVPA